MKSIGCDVNRGITEIKCVNPPNRSWKEFIGKNYSATFSFKPLELGDITIGNLSNNDEILTNGNSILVKYHDGTKWTINKSWFV